MWLNAIAVRPLTFSPKEIQWMGLMWSLVLSLGIMTSKSNAFRFGVLSPNWLYYFERWMDDYADSVFVWLDNLESGQGARYLTTGVICV